MLIIKGAFLIFEDPIYGSFNIDDAPILELVASYPMQRLRGVAQLGLGRKMVPADFPFFSRYEHCIGCMLLLRKLGAGLEEQVAGLLHDASHTVFSHTIDVIFGDYSKSDYQDNTHAKYIRESGIADILERYGFDPDTVSALSDYHLLDNEMPKLCADRVDYTLRELYHGVDPSVVAFCEKGLVAHSDEIVFRSKEQAKTFGEKYIQCRDNNWANPKWALKVYLLADAIRIALDEGIIGKEDLYKEDRYVLEKMERSGNAQIAGIMDVLNSDIVFETAESNPDYTLKAKRRYVDPTYFEGDNLRRLSVTDASYMELISRQSSIMGKGLGIRILGGRPPISTLQSG